MFGLGYITKSIQRCSRESFIATLDSKTVEDTCKLIKRLEDKLISTTDEKQQKWCKDRISQAKKTLPCITPMAWFKGDKRSVKNAVPSGLNMIDVDHVDNPAELYDEICKREVPYDVLLAHITPSTHGLRIIFTQPTDGTSIEEAQRKMAKAMGVAHDEVTKDLARCSFMVPRSYVLFMDLDNLFADYDVPEATNDANDTRGENEGATKKEKVPMSTSFKGIPYEEITRAILFAASYDQHPAEGERNTALYLLARNMRYICDFDVDCIINAIPDFGLPAHEVRATVESAVKSVRQASMPRQMQNILDGLLKQYSNLSEQGFAEEWDYVVNAEGIIGDIVNMYPDYLKNAAYHAAMCCFATICTRLRGRGLNGKMVAPNFMVCIQAPQAAGKSFMKDVYELITKPIFDHDEDMRKQLKEITRENRKNKDKEGYEEKEFEGDIRLLPTNTSNRILIERLDLAKGQHLLMMAEEIDSITKAEKTGKWSEKSDIYRLAFDNSKWGMDYANENSYTATVRLFLNLLFSGTPVSVARFFNDIENGLVTRFLFCDLPDNLGQKRAKGIEVDTETMASIEDRIKAIYTTMTAAKGDGSEIEIDTTQMRKDLLELYEEPQRIQFLCNQSDPCRGIVYRRYSIYGIAMMMVETWLNDGVYTESIRDRVISILKHDTEQLIALYGDEINESLNASRERHEKASMRATKLNMLDLVDEQFTSAEFAKVCIDQGLSKDYHNVYLKRMTEGGIIEKISRGIYKKILN